MQKPVNYFLIVQYMIKTGAFCQLIFLIKKKSFHLSKRIGSKKDCQKCMAIIKWEQIISSILKEIYLQIQKNNFLPGRWTV